MIIIIIIIVIVIIMIIVIIIIVIIIIIIINFIAPYNNIRQSKFSLSHRLFIKNHSFYIINYGQII